MKQPAIEGGDAVLTTAQLGFTWQTQDPFLFCVHHDDRYPAGNESMGPSVPLTGRNMGQDFEGIDGWRMYHGRVVPGFPQHPHRGFETVTVVRTGLLDHADSMGAAARYGGGDVQWLTAGGGIQHAEMFPLLERSAPNPLELFQIWLNLPRADKMVPPHFSMLWDESIPHKIVTDGAGRKTEIAVIAGRYEDATAPAPPPNSWAAKKDANVSIWTIKMDAQTAWTLPATATGTNRTLYFFVGDELKLGGRTIAKYHQVRLKPDRAVTLESGKDTIELLLLQGRPINEPVVQHGPFVMNSRQEISEAIADYRRTEFGGWPWDREDPVHGRERGRFARHADGRIDEPKPA